MSEDVENYKIVMNAINEARDLRQLEMVLNYVERFLQKIGPDTVAFDRTGRLVTEVREQLIRRIEEVRLGKE